MSTSSQERPVDVLDWRKWISGGLFLGMHLIPFAAIWTGFTWVDVVLCVALYFIRMFGVTGVYHRYFSHRTYKMGRVTQFLMAWLAMTSAQKGVLWWASHHRHHHKHSDKETDVHSPRQHGFWHSHMGWILSEEWAETDLERVKDLRKFPELVWLNRHPLLPAVTTGILVTAIFGWSGLVIGFFLSTVLLYHGTFTINSLSHVFGSQRYDTGDDSRNNLLLALITLGEGWHNNHHHYQASTRQGFRWYEIDITYYILKAMSWVGLVWDIREPPAHVVAGKRRKARRPAPRTPELAASSEPIPPVRPMSGGADECRPSGTPA